MAYYAYEEEEAWKCLKHPSKQRRRNGVCPICLNDRLIALCPDCASERPCACCPTNTTPPSSSSSSSSSISAGFGPAGPLLSLIDDEPDFRRSRSVAVPVLRSRLAGDRDSGWKVVPAPGNRRNSSIWSVFRTQKNKKCEEEEEEEEVDDYEQRVVMRSRSVGVAVAKGKSWHFPSPIKAFRQSKTWKVVQER